MKHSSTVRARIIPGACEKVASDFGLGSGFRRELRSPLLVTISHDLTLRLATFLLFEENSWMVKRAKTIPHLCASICEI